MKFIAGKIADKVNEFYSSGVVVASNFLEPSEVVEVKGVLKNTPFVLYGGFEKAERKVIFIGADDDFENFYHFTSHSPSCCNFPYSSSLTGSSHSLEPFSPGTSIAR